jgi:hypothetical protein
MGAVLLSAGYLAGVAAPDRLARGGDPEGFQRGNVDLGNVGNGWMVSRITSSGTRARIARVACCSHSPASGPSA